MPVKNNTKELPFFELSDRFINDSRRGKRLQPNGKRISNGTVANYAYTCKLLLHFCERKQFRLRIRTTRRLSRREAEMEKNYWKKFYKQFSAYLYDDCGHYDNYVGQNMKNIRMFFNYLNKELALGVGEFL